jgi:hypothetical protein
MSKNKLGAQYSFTEMDLLGARADPIVVSMDKLRYKTEATAQDNNLN